MRFEYAGESRTDIRRVVKEEGSAEKERENAAADSALVAEVADVDETADSWASVAFEFSSSCSRRRPRPMFSCRGRSACENFAGGPENAYGAPVHERTSAMGSADGSQ